MKEWLRQASLFLQQHCWMDLFSSLYSSLLPQHLAFLCCSTIIKVSSVMYDYFFPGKRCLSSKIDSHARVISVLISSHMVFESFVSGHVIFVPAASFFNSASVRIVRFSHWPFQVDLQLYFYHLKMMIWGRISSWVCFGSNVLSFPSFLYQNTANWLLVWPSHDFYVYSLRLCC